MQITSINSNTNPPATTPAITSLCIDEDEDEDDALELDEEFAPSLKELEDCLGEERAGDTVVGELEDPGGTKTPCCVPPLVDVDEEGVFL